MKIGDRVYISPELTMQSGWEEGTAIDVENNSFVGVVISARTQDGNIFFGKEDMFAITKP